MSNCIIPGGNDAEACEISVELEEKSATSYSKRTVWTLDDSNKANKRMKNIHYPYSLLCVIKAIGAAALSNTSWSHVTINLPATETETLITLKLKHNYNKAGQ